MADSITPPLPDEEDTLDLRTLVRPPRRIRSSAGVVLLRRMADLSPIDRAKVATLYAQAQGDAERLEAGDPSAPADLDALAAESAGSEDDLMRLILVDCSQEVLDALPAPERAALLALFFGATAEGARQAAAAVAEFVERITAQSVGVSSSPGSAASTAATR